MILYHLMAITNLLQNRNELNFVRCANVTYIFIPNTRNVRDEDGYSLIHLWRSNWLRVHMLFLKFCHFEFPAAVYFVISLDVKWQKTLLTFRRPKMYVSLCVCVCVFVLLLIFYLLCEFREQYSLWLSQFYEYCMRNVFFVSKYLF